MTKCLIKWPIFTQIWIILSSINQFDQNVTKNRHKLNRFSSSNLFLLSFRQCVPFAWTASATWYSYAATGHAKCVVTGWPNVPFVARLLKNEFCFIKIKKKNNPKQNKKEKESLNIAVDLFLFHCSISYYFKLF